MNKYLKVLFIAMVAALTISVGMTGCNSDTVEAVAISSSQESSQSEQEEQAKEDEKTRELEAEALAIQEAEALAIQEAEAVAQKEAEALALQEAEAQALKEAEAQAQKEAQAAMQQAQAQAQKDAEVAGVDTSTPKPTGSKADAWQPAPGETRPDADGYGGGGSSTATTSKPSGSGGSKDGATGGPTVGGGGSSKTMDELVAETIKIKGKDWVGKEEPPLPVSDVLAESFALEWDSSIGGWRDNRGGVNFPDGSSVRP